MRLILIRHGQTPHNVTGALDTAFPGAGLTPLGGAQAGAVPAALAERDLAGIYASPLVRTQLTAGPLAAIRGLDVRVTPGVEEVAAGELELRSDQEAVRTYVETLISWMHGDLARAMPGGMSGHDFYQGYDAALQEIAAAHGSKETVAVFSHGAAIRVYTSLAARLDPNESTKLWMMNTGMGVLEGDPHAGWELTQWHPEPLGGLDLEDPAAHDVTGEAPEEAVDDA
ncbi:histidine phosphatase family protein [Nocardioides daejeonensis]|uniref:histidine phosphatase family protein n=1 Tax=Nocardioides daejeonensis TaxID=1046556 RepID=UPI000D74813F|nr:histidine phosphatase family protein [Nocardioides daejeonensis]